MPAMKEVIQITLEKNERTLLNMLLDVATTFIALLHDSPMNVQDAQILLAVIAHPTEVEALIKKINADQL